jgi:hypothetical protein
MGRRRGLETVVGDDCGVRRWRGGDRGFGGQWGDEGSYRARESDGGGRDGGRETTGVGREGTEA